MLVDRREQEKREDALLAPYGMRSARSRGRRYPEDEHPLRTCFQRDRDRVVHSSSFRRLEYKTQVFVNHEGDNYRTRLTHSLEGAQIGTTVARALGLNEELTECLVLGHDLGHTPFGHSGERAMDELMKDHGGFEHNRQTLRILEVLERRYPTFPGLNLTWETREGIIKHRPDSDAKAPAEYAPGQAPTLEAQLVDFVDEIAYNNHDVDDGLASGMFPVEAIRSVPLFREAHDQALAQGIPDERILRHQVVRRIINRCGDGRAGARAEGLPPAQHVPSLPRGPDGGQGGTDPPRPLPLLHGGAAPAPSAFPGADRAGRRTPRRLRLHRGDDRPLRGGRAPEAVRPHGARLI
jgi:dGTPase